MRAHFALIKLKLKRTFSLTASCIETLEIQNISLQEQVLSVLKCTDESSLVALGKYLFPAVQMRKKLIFKKDSKVVHIRCSAFLVSQKVLAKTVHSPPRTANTVSVIAAEDD